MTNTVSKKGIYNLLVLAVSTLLVFIASTYIAHAQATYAPLAGVPGIGTAATNNTSAYINALYNLSITAAALLVVVKLIMAGVKYMFSEMVPKKQEAKADIRNALFGLLIILSAVLILNTINPNLTNISFLSDAGTFRSTIETNYDTQVVTDTVNNFKSAGRNAEGSLYTCDKDNSPSCDDVISSCENSPGYIISNHINQNQVACYIDKDVTEMIDAVRNRVSVQSLSGSVGQFAGYLSPTEHQQYGQNGTLPDVIDQKISEAATFCGVGIDEIQYDVLAASGGAAFFCPGAN